MERDYHFTYEYNYPVSSSDDLFGVIMSVYLIILTLALLFALVGYIFYSVGLYTIGKRMGKENPWLAFIPYARDYFQGELAGPVRLNKKEIRSPGIWNLVIPIISSVLAGGSWVVMSLAGGLMSAAGISGSGSAGIALLFVIMMYTLLTVAVIAARAAQKVLKILINKQILERFTSGNMGLVHAVLMIIVPLYEAFCFFVMRNRDFNPGMEPEITPPPALLPPSPSQGGPQGPAATPQGPVPTPPPTPPQGGPQGPAATPPPPPSPSQGGPQGPVPTPPTPPSPSQGGPQGPVPTPLASPTPPSPPEADRAEKTE